MLDTLTAEEIAAFQALASIEAPIPDGWVEITAEFTEGFDLDVIAYGLAYLDPEALDEGEADVDWAVWLRWDGFLVVYDEENSTEDVPFAAAPPEVNLCVLVGGARAILNRLKEQQ